MAEAEQHWVSQSEAAELETKAGRTVSQSRISRFLADNPDVPVRRAPGGMVRFVEYNALRAARAASLSVQDNLSLRETPPARLPGPSAANSTERKRSAEAEAAELRLAERKGELLSRDAASAAIEAAGAAFVQALERRRRSLAQKITGLPDFRAVELELKSADRVLLEALVSDLTKAAQEMSGASVAA
jgi:hypothetical protein